MPFDPYDRQDDDMGRLGLQTDLFGSSYQPPPLGKFNHTSHATPPPTAASALVLMPKTTGLAHAPIKTGPWLTLR